MAYTYEELKKMTVAQMREIAAGIEHEALQGYTQLNKEHLIVALCNALGLEMHAHHEVVGIDKSKIKSEIKALKKKRAEFITAKNHLELIKVRKKIRNLKKTLRKATV
jgi:hypothetical protein